MVQERWSTLCKLRPGAESGRIAGQHHSSSDPCPSRHAQLDDPESAQTRTVLARIAGRPHSSLDSGPSQPGHLVDPTAPQTREQVVWNN